MAISFSCPGCGHRVVSHSLGVGDEFRCPGCRGSGQVPHGAETAAVSPFSPLEASQGSAHAGWPTTNTERPRATRYSGHGVQYEPSLIQQFAQRLYERANSTILLYTVFGALVGGLIGALLSGAVGNRGAGAPFALCGMLVLGLVGHALGSEKAFWIKLQAQTALCQAQIEKNTRPRE